MHLVRYGVQHAERRRQQPLLPQGDAVRPEIDRDHHADTKGTVDIHMRPLADVGVEVFHIEPDRRDGRSLAVLHRISDNCAKLVRRRPLLGREKEDQRHDSQRDSQGQVFGVVFHGVVSPLADFS